MDRGRRLGGAGRQLLLQPGLTGCHRGGIKPIPLAELEHIHPSELLLHQISHPGVVPEAFDALQIHHQQHPGHGKAVEEQLARDPFRHGHAAGLDQHMGRRFRPSGQLQQRSAEPIPQGAAHATTAQLQHAAMALAQPLGIDVDAAQIIHQHSPALQARRLQPAVDQGGFAGSEITADHGGRHPLQGLQRCSGTGAGAHAAPPGAAPWTQTPSL